MFYVCCRCLHSISRQINKLKVNYGHSIRNIIIREFLSKQRNLTKRGGGGGGGGLVAASLHHLTMKL